MHWYHATVYVLLIHITFLANKVSDLIDIDDGICSRVNSRFATRDYQKYFSASSLAIWAPGSKRHEAQRRTSREQWNQRRNLRARHPVLSEHRLLPERCMHVCRPFHIQTALGHIHRLPVVLPQMNTYTVTFYCIWFQVLLLVSLSWLLSIK